MTPHRARSSTRVAASLALLAAACDGGSVALDGGAAPDGGPLPRPSRCGGDDQRPARDVDGRTTCVRTGHRGVAASGEWPADEGLQAPVRYVRAGASAAGATGARDAPFADLAAAFASLPDAGGSVVLSRGRHRVSATLAARGAVTVAGAGSVVDGGTVLEAPTVTMLEASGAGVRATVRAVVVLHGEATPSAPTLRVAEGASMRLDDVALEAPRVGVRAEGGARLEATGFTVRRAAELGVHALGGSRCVLRDVLVRDGRGRGVEVRDGHLVLHGALVHENAGVGVLLVTTAMPSTTGGVARCTAAGPSSEPGALSCLADAAITCNGTAAVFAQGPQRVGGERLVLSGTRAVTGTPGGDGLVVQGGAAFDLDADATARGAGSEVVGNARIGVLAQNVNTRLTLRGATVSANGSAGLFVGNLAIAPVVAANEFAFNTGVGVAVATSTEVGELRGNAIRDTRAGALPGGAVMIGDGLSAGNAALGAVVGNELSRNPRFAGVFAAASGVLSQNTGVANGFTLYKYDSPGLRIDATNRVEGREGDGRPSLSLAP